MTDTRPNEPAGDSAFAWHPEYRGRAAADVRRELADEIANDQRAYELALEGAERAENASLASVMELEKRWGVYSFDWADMDPDELAGRIVDFELARERRQELFPYAEYRDREQSATARGAVGQRAAMTDGQRRRMANIGAAVILVIVAIIVIGVIFAVI